MQNSQCAFRFCLGFTFLLPFSVKVKRSGLDENLSQSETKTTTKGKTKTRLN